MTEAVQIRLLFPAEGDATPIRAVLGPRGFTPVLAFETWGDGDSKVALKVASWSGPDNTTTPATGYLAADGTLVADIEDSLDLANPANAAGTAVLDAITAAGLVVTGVGGTIDVREDAALTAIGAAETAVIGAGGTIDDKVAEVVADGGPLDVAVDAAVAAAVAPGGALDQAVEASIVAGTAVLDGAAADLAGVGGPLDLREDLALEAIATREASAISAVQASGAGVIAAASARIFETDTTALTALAVSESGWVRPVYGTHANGMYDNAGVTARRFGETLAISQAGIDISNIKALQSLQELTTPFPAPASRLWHHRAMDAFATDGRAIPNRLADTIPERWNILNFSDGEIRIASLGNASTITLNASGTAARFDIADAQFAGLLPTQGYGALLSNFAGGWVFGMDAAAVSVSEDIRIGQAATAYQAATIATGTISALTPMVFSQANYDGAGQLVLGVPVTAGDDAVSIYIDNLKLYEGTTLPSGSGVDKDWHLKANFATRGALRPITSFGGYGIDLRQRRMAVTFDNTTEEVLCNGHGLQTGDGPFKIALQYALNRTFTADASTDRLTVSAVGDDVVAGIALAPGPFYLTTTGTLPAGLSLATPYWLHGLAGTTAFKLATSEANALAGTAVDITDAGTGTHTIRMTIGTGLSVDTNYFAIRVSEGRFKLATTRPRAVAGTNITFTTNGTGAFYLDSVNMPAVAVPPSFPARSSYSAFTLSVTWEAVSNPLFDNLGSQAQYLASVIKDGSVTRDNLAILADPYTTFLHKYPESADAGQIRLADLGCQVLTTTVSATEDCLWIGYAPLLDKIPGTATGGWATPVSMLGMTYFGYYAGAAPATAALVTPSNANGIFRAGHGYNKRLSVTEMDAHVDAERAHLALEGKQTSSDVTMHIVVGTSIDALTTSWAYVLGADKTISPRFNNANKAVGGSALSQTNGTTFPTGWIPYAENQFGAEAAFRGCLKNGWNVVLWIGGLPNDAKQIINWNVPGSYAQDPGTELDLTPAELMAFGQRFIDIGKEDAAWAGKYAVAVMMTAPRSGFAAFEVARVPFNTAVEALVNAAPDDGWFYVSYAGTDMNDPASTTNPALFSGDGLHWVGGGHAIVANVVKTVTLPAIHTYFGVG